ncbi:hypothetical protein E8E12_000469 [Didymella heteroderae]|uniref:Subtilisin-like serine protease protein n=1 Tax=Didymella heteroderae TaxID=1769908 RepID=A0A9P5BU27_9PLEO|nr:hypothetical protein E8E12_000469 [Didymella heteroderae]
MEPPFLAQHQFNTDLDDAPVSQNPSQYLPGYPRILLYDRPRLTQFLEKEFCSEDLERISDRLWCMSRQDSANISPLHRQRVKRRSIVVTEEPKLHLVWIDDRIFVKPLPRYLTSHVFWRDYLGDGAGATARGRLVPIRKAALGYFRTYFNLIQSESDFRIAQEASLQLVPADMTWEQFCNLTARLVTIADDQVSGRYAYGEIRLSRLNFYAPLFLRKWHFQRVEYQYKEYFALFYAPILFAAGVSSILLSGFQVAVAVQQTGVAVNSAALLHVALWSSVAIILCFCAVGLSMLSLFVYKVGKEWRYAIQCRVQLSREERRKSMLGP